MSPNNRIVAAILSAITVGAAMFWLGRYTAPQAISIDPVNCGHWEVYLWRPPLDETVSNLFSGQDGAEPFAVERGKVWFRRNLCGAAQ